jgi:hypothetical protein
VRITERATDALQLDHTSLADQHAETYRFSAAAQDAAGGLDNSEYAKPFRDHEAGAKWHEYT